MSKHWKPIAACLGVAILLAVAGCGSSNKPSAEANKEASPESGGAPRKPASDPDHPVVQIDTSMGTLTVRLDANTAPLTVNNFLSYVDAGHYDQTLIHQVNKGQTILGGGYGTNLLERPGRTPVRNEAHNGVKNRRGTIAMARSPDEFDSATCQFFINVADNPALDHRDRDRPEAYGYCVFGEVTKGMDVVDKMADVEVSDTTDFERMPVKPIVVNSIRRIQ